MKDSNLLQTLSRGLKALEAVAQSPTPIPAQQVSDAVGLSLPTAFRLLKTLEEAGFLERDGRLYRLSPVKLEALQSGIERSITLHPALPKAMHRLARLTEETTYASVWHRGDVVIADVAEGCRAVRVAGIHVGLRGHAHARASGKALLAFGPENRLQGYLDRTSLEALTPKTICDADALMSDLSSTRCRGYSIDREEFTEGVSCLGVPIHDAGGKLLGVLTLSVPTSRFEIELEHNIQAGSSVAKSAMES